jgi:hypothetical protein
MHDVDTEPWPIREKPKGRLGPMKAPRDKGFAVEPV